MNYEELRERVAQFMRGDGRAERPPYAPPAQPRRFTGPAEYRSLHKYLDGRYADTVVLTFGQIEDLLGFSLPDLARRQQEWWANAADADSAPSAQSRSWTEASRIATPNLAARNVSFDRTSV
jgi:hypothetical protein